jgi:hypothetical protein
METQSNAARDYEKTQDTNESANVGDLKDEIYELQKPDPEKKDLQQAVLLPDGGQGMRTHTQFNLGGEFNEQNVDPLRQQSDANPYDALASESSSNEAV